MRRGWKRKVCIYIYIYEVMRVYKEGDTCIVSRNERKLPEETNDAPDNNDTN